MDDYFATKEELKEVKDELDRLRERLAVIDGVGTPWCYRRCRPDDHYRPPHVGDDPRTWHLYFGDDPRDWRKE